MNQHRVPKATCPDWPWAAPRAPSLPAPPQAPLPLKTSQHTLSSRGPQYCDCCALVPSTTGGPPARRASLRVCYRKCRNIP